MAFYRKAKAEPQGRFYRLYGEICREEVLMEAVRQVVANQGAPGRRSLTCSWIIRFFVEG